jgi:hypothetical protein
VTGIRPFGFGKECDIMDWSSGSLMPLGGFFWAFLMAGGVVALGLLAMICSMFSSMLSREEEADARAVGIRRKERVVSDDARCPICAARQGRHSEACSKAPNPTRWPPEKKGSGGK